MINAIKNEIRLNAKEISFVLRTPAAYWIGFGKGSKRKNLKELAEKKLELHSLDARLY